MGKWADKFRNTPVVNDPEMGADFMSLAESHRADDPQTRANILAENRFPNLSKEQRTARYHVKDGQISYQADDGQWYRSEPSGRFFTDVGANMVGHVEAMAGSGGLAAAGTIAGGPVGGLLGAALGGAGGEGIRKTIANLIYDEPQTVTGNVKAMAKEAAFAGAGEGVGQLASKMLARGAVRDLGKFDEAATGLLTDKAHKVGVQLTPAEITNLKSLTNRQALLRDLPESSDVIEDFLKARNKQVQRATYDYLNNLSPEKTPHFAYKQGIKAAEGAREGLDVARAKAASPLYEAARNDPVNVRRVLSVLDDRIGLFSGTKVGRSLQQVKASLMSDKGPKNLIGEVDAAKQNLDDMISVAKREGNRTRLRELTGVKAELVELMDRASETYRAGREMFESMSGPINMLDKSMAGEVIKQGNKPAPNLGRVLFGKSSSPAAVKQTRQIISSHSPEAWDGVVRGHIQSIFEEIADSSVTDAGNLAGVFRKKLMGTETKRRMLQNALSKQQYSTLDDLMEVFNATGRAMKGQSITAQRQVMIEEMKREAGSTMSNIIAPHRIPTRIHQWYEDARLGRYSEKLARIMTDPEGMRKLQKQVKLLKKLSPREQAFNNALGAAWGTMLGNETD